MIHRASVLAYTLRNIFLLRSEGEVFKHPDKSEGLLPLRIYGVCFASYVWVPFPFLILSLFLTSSVSSPKPGPVCQIRQQISLKKTDLRDIRENSPVNMTFWAHGNNDYTSILHIATQHCELHSNFDFFPSFPIIPNMSTYLLPFPTCNQSPQPTGILPQWLPPYLVQMPPTHHLAWPSSHFALNPTGMWPPSAVCWPGPKPCWSTILLLAQPRGTLYHT